MRMPRGRLLLAVPVAALIAGVGAVLSLGWNGGEPAPAVFRVAGQPTDVVAAAGRVWVAGQRSGSVWVLDSDTGRLAGRPLRTGGAPSRLALAQGGIWAADAAHATVVAVQWRPRRVYEPIAMGPDISDVALAAGAVWTVSSADGKLRVLERGTRPAAIVQAGADPVAIAADDRQVAVADAGDGTVMRFER